MNTFDTNVATTSVAIEAAWAAYQAELQGARERIQSVWYYNRDARVRIQAEYYLQQLVGSAFAMAIMPRPDFPAFRTDTFLAPNTFNHSGPNPDTRYQLAHLNGRRSYRLWGRRYTNPFCYLQLNRDYWVPESRMLGSWMLEDFDVDADGGFEIILGGPPRERDWIPLDETSGNNVLMIRSGSADWEGETPPEFHIEATDLGEGVIPSLDLDEAELAERILRAGRLIRYVTDEFTIGLARTYWDKAGRQPNVFSSFSGAEQTAGGAPTFATYGTAFFDIDADEALILESDVPKGILWHFMARDPWLQATDYVYHQSSLNMHQARLDSDGRFRAVLSLADPGVANWIDPMGMTFGMLQYRWYKAQSEPKPTLKKVALRDVRAHLPPDTPDFSAAQRTDQLRSRWHGISRRYGY